MHKYGHSFLPLPSYPHPSTRSSMEDLCHLISASRTSPNPGLFPPLMSTPDLPGHHRPPDYFLLSSIQGLVSDPDPDTHHVGAPHEGCSPVVNPVNVDVKMECDGGGGRMGKWPRQETLTLLEIRSKMDSRFKQANHKGLLWDEVSRVMFEEYGHQRSGKKCREKFENLYKYYKKTKEGKSGRRQDGKNYRFFRQLEALYGDSTSNQTETSFEGHCDGGAVQKVGKKGKCQSSWKEKMKEFVDSRVRKVMEKQDEWMWRMTRALEENEKERVVREEEWRRRDSERFAREKDFWEKERAWIEARDTAFMNAVQRFTMEGGHETVMAAAKKKKKRKEIEQTPMVHGASSHNDNDGDNISFRYLIGDPGDDLWENYEVKLDIDRHPRNQSVG